MFVILSVLVWQETGIIRGGEALFLLWIQSDYFFLECVSLEEMDKTDQGNLHVPSKGLQNYGLQSQRWRGRNAPAVIYNFPPAEFWWWGVSRTGETQCLGGESCYLCTNTLIINNDEEWKGKFPWQFNRILGTSDILMKFCMNPKRDSNKFLFPFLMEVKQILAHLRAYLLNIM